MSGCNQTLLQAHADKLLPSLYMVEKSGSDLLMFFCGRSVMQMSCPCCVQYSVGIINYSLLMNHDAL